MERSKPAPFNMSEPASLISPDLSRLLDLDGGEWNSPLKSPLKDADFHISPKNGYMQSENTQKARSSAEPGRFSIFTPDLTALPNSLSDDLINGGFNWDPVQVAPLQSSNHGQQQYVNPMDFGQAYVQSSNWNHFGNLTTSGNHSLDQLSHYEYPDLTQMFHQQPYYGISQPAISSFHPPLSNGGYHNAYGPSLFQGTSTFDYWSPSGVQPQPQGWNYTANSAADMMMQEPKVIPEEIAINHKYSGDNVEEGTDVDDEGDGPGLYAVKRDNRRKVYRAEKPAKDIEHSWVRTNASTQGKSTRTGKINAYNPSRDGKYSDTDHPTGDWTGEKGTLFKYTRHGELRKLTFTVREMREFLLNHPLANSENGRLTLWIQKTPADSGRRYPTVGSSKCRFADCPAGIFTRSISVGHFRVAIDEQWETYKATKDPYHVAMYVHLYCLERFMDFPEICRNLNVRGDNRELISEPKGKFLPSLDFAQHSIAEAFIKACRKSTLSIQFSRYPVHDQRSPKKEKNHKYTLNCALTVSKNQSLNVAKVAMMENRGLTATNILVHKGDLQMAIDAKSADNASRKKARQKRVYLPGELNTRPESGDESSEEYERTAAPKKPSARFNQSHAKRTVPMRRSSRSSAVKARKIHQTDSSEERDASESEYRPSKTHQTNKRWNLRSSSDTSSDSHKGGRRKRLKSDDPARHDQDSSHGIERPTRHIASAYSQTGLPKQHHHQGQQLSIDANALGELSGDLMSHDSMLIDPLFASESFLTASQPQQQQAFPRQTKQHDLSFPVFF